MTMDRYTKIVLTVIAVSLFWMAFGERLTPTVSAQNESVYIAGWIDEAQHFHKLPNRPTNVAEPIPVMSAQ